MCDRLNQRVTDVKEEVAAVESMPEAWPTGANELLERIPTLFAKIGHGSQDHRDWLEKAITAHFLGEPLPDYKS